MDKTSSDVSEKVDTDWGDLERIQHIVIAQLAAAISPHANVNKEKKEAEPSSKDANYGDKVVSGLVYGVGEGGWGCGPGK